MNDVNDVNNINMRLSTLFRTPFTQVLLARRRKPQVTDETLFERKETKRMKLINALDNDETSISNLI